MIIFRGRPHAVATDSSLLFYDANSWVRWEIHWHEIEAGYAENDGDLASAADFSAMAHHLGDWLETGAFPRRRELPLRLRLMIKPSVVRRASLHNYLDTVMTLSSITSFFKNC